MENRLLSANNCKWEEKEGENNAFLKAHHGEHRSR